MQARVVRPAVGQPVDQPRVTVVGEDHRAVRGEQRVELTVTEAVRMLGRRLQPHEVDDVDHPDRQVRQLSAQDRRRGKDFQGRGVTGAGEDNVGFVVGVAARPVPDAHTAGAMQSRLLGVEPVRRVVLARHDHVHVVTATQAMLGDLQQSIGIRREIYADDFGNLVRDVVDETRVLVGEAVVVLTPDVRGQQVVQGRHRTPPRDLAVHLEPIDVLVDHRIHDVHERLIAREQPVPPGQQVPLEPALAQMLRQDFEDTAVASEVLVDRLDRGLPLLAGDLVHGVEPIGGRLVRAEKPEVGPVRVQREHITQIAAQRPGRFRAGRAGPRHGDGVVTRGRQHERAQERPAVGVRVGAHAPVAARDQRGHDVGGTATAVEEFLRPV